MTLPVFIAPEAAALRGCALGDSYTLDGDEGFHAATVRRMDVGQMLDLVDGDGLRVRGSVIERAKKSLILRVEEIIHEAPPSVRLVLVQALSTGGRDEMAIEMATEVDFKGGREAVSSCFHSSPRRCLHFPKTCSVDWRRNSSRCVGDRLPREYAGPFEYSPA